MEKLYATVKEAAELVGIGISTMRDFMNSDDPPPYLRIGEKRLLQVAALEPYFERKQEVRLSDPPRARR